MADITCRIDGEPWDADTIHEEVAERAYLGEEATYSQVSAEFAAKGCQAFRAFTGNDQPCTPRRSARTEGVGALMDLGLTPDEATAELDDMGVFA